MENVRDGTLHMLLDAALPGLSPRAQAVVRALADAAGRVASAQFLARRLGLRSRHQLARLLKNEGLPGAEELSGWISVLAWVLEAEQRGESLFKVGHACHTDPATCYRVVRRVTGRRWSEIRPLGVEWVLLRIRQLHPAEGARETSRKVHVSA